MGFGEAREQGYERAQSAMPQRFEHFGSSA
jgi:hypothetical protein